MPEMENTEKMSWNQSNTNYNSRNTGESPSENTVLTGASLNPTKEAEEQGTLIKSLCKS